MVRDSLDLHVQDLSEDEIGQALIKRGLEQGQAQGWEQGQAQGQAQAGERILLALIRIRFGDSSEAQAVARMLSGWNDKEAAVAAITSAPDAASLLSLTPDGR